MKFNEYSRNDRHLNEERTGIIKYNSITLKGKELFDNRRGDLGMEFTCDDGLLHCKITVMWDENCVVEISNYADWIIDTKKHKDLDSFISNLIEGGIIDNSHGSIWYPEWDY